MYTCVTSLSVCINSKANTMACFQYTFDINAKSELIVSYSVSGMLFPPAGL